MTSFKKIFSKKAAKLVLVLATAALAALPGRAYMMSSASYEINADSINIGGAGGDAGANHLEDTTGEIGTGMSSDTYKVSAGYQAMWEYPPVLTFTVDDNLVPLGTLSTGAPATGISNFSVATNAADGYAVSIAGITLTTSLGEADIDALAEPTASSPGSEQFGINLVDNFIPDVGANPSGGIGEAAAGYNTANLFKFATGDTLATSDTYSQTTTYTVSYLANIDGTVAPGEYYANLTLIATAQF